MDYIDDTIIGDPEDQSSYWEMQTEPDNCAVMAEMGIIHQFGMDITQDEANYISAENGWYNPGSGTSMNDIGNMMDLYGISNHSCHGASVADLARELQQGHGVIVGVNSDQLWEQGPLAEIWHAICKALGFDTPEFMPANHAITVTGIDVSDPANPMVIINDSGHPEGAAARYPMARFIDAWDNSGFYYTATDNPLPDNDMESISNLDFTEWLGIGAGVGAGIGVFSVTGELTTAFETGVAVEQTVTEVAGKVGEAVEIVANVAEDYFNNIDNIAQL